MCPLSFLQAEICRCLVCCDLCCGVVVLWPLFFPSCAQGNGEWGMGMEEGGMAEGKLGSAKVGLLQSGWAGERK